MWKISGDYTIEMAREFLIQDFLKVVLRTKYLYLETEPKEGIGHGYFEPILLGLCWRGNGENGVRSCNNTY